MAQVKNSSFAQKSASTKHYMLSQLDKIGILLNFNGISKASRFEKLGQRRLKMTYLPRLLSNVYQRSGLINCIDVVVVKKYPIYYSEFI